MGVNSEVGYSHLNALRDLGQLPWLSDVQISGIARSSELGVEHLTRSGTSTSARPVSSENSPSLTPVTKAAQCAKDVAVARNLSWSEAYVFWDSASVAVVWKQHWHVR